MSSYFGSNQVHGHTLRSEGAPHREDRSRIGWNGTAGKGRGLCSCGALSDVLPSASQRKQWHREHKQTIRDEMRQA